MKGKDPVKAGKKPPKERARRGAGPRKTPAPIGRSLYDSIWGASPIAIELYDAAGQLVEANPACLELFGIGDLSEVKGFNLFEGPNVSAAHKERLARGETVRYQAPFDFGLVHERKLYRTSRGNQIIHLEVLITPLREGGAIGGYLVQLQDLTARVEAENSLRSERSRFSATLKAIPDLLFEVDREGRIHDFRAPRFIELYAPPDLFLGKTVAEVLPPDAAEAILQAIDEAARRGWHTGATYRLPLSEGERWFELTISAKDQVGAGSSRFIVLARDVTKRRQAEADLEKLHNTLMEAQRIAHLGSFEYDAATQTTRWSEEERRIYGMDPGGPSPAYDVMLETFIHPEDSALLHETFSRAMQTGSVYELEHRIVRPDGSVRWVYDKAHPYFDENGRLLRYVGVTLDITERRQAEEEQQNSAESLRQALEAAQAGTWDWDIVKNGFRWSAEFRRIFGMAPDTQAGFDSWLQSVHPEDRQAAQGRIAEALRERRDLVNEYRIVRPDRAVRWIRATGRAIYEGDRAVRLSGLCVDITERRREDEEREAMVELLRLVNAGTGLRELMRELTGYLQRWSGCEAVGARLRQGDDYPYYETRGFPAEFVEAERYLCAGDDAGNTLHDAAGNPLLDCMCGNILQGRFDPKLPFFSPRGSFWSNGTTALLASTTEADRQARTRNRCNGEGYESVALVPMRHGGQTYGLLQFNDRRTDRFGPERIALFERLADQLAIAVRQRLDREALGESEIRFRSIFENSVDAIGVAKEGCHVLVNPAYLALFGYSRSEELIGKSTLEVIAPGERLTLRDRMRRRAEGENVLSIYETRGLKRDGFEFDMEVHLSTYESKGETHTLVVIRDITVRKQAEQALRESERNLSTLFNAISESVCLFEPDGKVVAANQTFASRLGLQVDECLGRPIYDLVPPEVAANRRTVVEEILQTGDHQRFLDQRGGRWIDQSVYPVKDAGGRVVRLVTFAVDVTERKQAELALQVSESRLRFALETSHIGAWELDLSDHSAIRSFEHDRIFGYPEPLPQWTYEMFLEHVLPEDRSEVAGKFQSAIETRGDWNFECRIRRCDGEIRWILAAGRHLDDALGAGGRIAGIVQDITLRKQVEEERLQHIQQLMQADKMVTLGILVAGVAHEINNPNNFIMMNADIISRAWRDIQPILERHEREHGDFFVAGLPYQDLHGRFLALVNGIQEGTQRIQAIVADLKEYAVPDPSDMNGTVEVNRALQAAVHLTRNMIQKSTACFAQRLAGGLPGVRGSSQKLEQVFINLIQNACQALTDPRQAIEVSSAFEPATGRVKVIVRDGGRGISAEALRHLTDPFFTTRRQSGGTGLGLSICRRIVEDHDGALRFDSTPGEGMTVTVELPGLG